MSDESMLSSFVGVRIHRNWDCEAVYDYDNNVRYTYGQMSQRSNTLAAFLMDELGLSKGDRIAFCSVNSVACLDAFGACMRSGMILTTYNHMLRAKELEVMIRKETPRVLFYSARFDATIDELKASGLDLIYIVLDDATCENAQYYYEDIMKYEAQRKVLQTDLSYEDTLMLLHTGGTTGAPKAAMLSYRAIFYNTVCSTITGNLSHKDCHLVYLPFYHTGGWNAVTLGLLLAGGRIIISGGFHPTTALTIIREERPTVGFAVEVIYKAMADHPDWEKTDISTYRWLMNGGAPISLETMSRYWERGVKLFNGLGMTEIGPNNIMPAVNEKSIEELSPKWNSVGVPMFFNNIRIVDEEGRDVAVGEQGELIWRGNLCFSGYWEDEESTAETIRDGWVHSGDMGYVDEDGYYFLSGRKKLMYISGGENIFPIEIEQEIQSHPDVEAVCVIGVLDDKWGETGKALIVRKPGTDITKEDIRAYLSARIAKIKIPTYVQFIDVIPRNSVGKVDLNTTREMFGFPGDE